MDAKTEKINQYVKFCYMGLITGAELAYEILEIYGKEWRDVKIARDEYRKVMQKYWS